MFENHKGAPNLKIFQLDSSNLHKRYMARKFWPSSETRWLLYHIFNVKWGYPIKRPNIAPRGSECENNL